MKVKKKKTNGSALKKNPWFGAEKIYISSKKI